jgi:hypothetical protein
MYTTTTNNNTNPPPLLSTITKQTTLPPILVHPPHNKNEFFTRWRKLEFGNLPRMWTCLEDFEHDIQFNGEVSIRSLIPGGPALYRVPAELLRHDPITRTRLPLRGGFIIQESMPDQFLEIQGTVSLGMDGIELEYSLAANLKFREALAPPFGHYAKHLQAVMILRNHCDPSGLDDIWVLLDRFPSAIIEFATYHVPVGVLMRRTIIFEVRNY